MVLRSLVIGRAGKAPLVSGQQHRRLFFHSVVHHTTTFQSYFDGQAGKGSEHRSAAARLRRCDAMELLKGFRKAFRTVVAVLIRHVDHFFTGVRQLRARESQPAAADVLPQRVAAEDAEHPLEMERGRKAFSGDLPVIQLLRKMLLDVVDGALNTVDPIHADPSCLTSVSHKILPLS